MLPGLKRLTDSLQKLLKTPQTALATPFSRELFGFAATELQGYFDQLMMTHGLVDDSLTSEEFSTTISNPRNVYVSTQFQILNGEQVASEALSADLTSNTTLPFTYLILGNYGSGKSYFARKVLERSIQALKDGSSDSRLPIFLPLKNCSGQLRILSSPSLWKRRARAG